MARPKKSESAKAEILSFEITFNGFMCKSLILVLKVDKLCVDEVVNFFESGEFIITDGINFYSLILSFTDIKHEEGYDILRFISNGPLYNINFESVFVAGKTVEITKVKQQQ